MKPAKLILVAVSAAAFVLPGCDNKPAPQQQQPQQAEPPKPKPVPLLEQPVGSLVSGNTEYAKYLLKKYGHLIHYENEQAKIAVESFNIDCHERDNRYLPLINVLALKLKVDDGSGYIFYAQNRQSETRILMVDGGPSEEKSGVIEFEINKWGEMRSRIQAIRLIYLCDDRPQSEAIYIMPPVQK